jgi:hypothetical protein
MPGPWAWRDDNLKPAGWLPVSWGAMPIDPRELARMAGPKPIEHDKPCHRCGYNLVGLSEAGRCPECGQPIRSQGTFTRFADHLTDAPIAYLKTLALGMGLLAAGGVGVTICLVGLWATAGSTTWAPDAYAVALAIMGWVWWGGLYIVTQPRVLTERTIRDAVLDSSRFRKAVRVLQLALPVGAVMLVSAFKMNTLMMSGAAGLALIVAVVGMVPVAVYLSSLAEWAGHDHLVDMLRGSAWVLALSGTILLGTIGVSIAYGSSSAPWIYVILASFSALAVFCSLVVMLWCLLRMALMCSWAINNALEAMERDRRIAERRDREQRELEARLPEPGSPAPDPLGARDHRR